MFNFMILDEDGLGDDNDIPLWEIEEEMLVEELESLSDSLWE